MNWYLKIANLEQPRINVVQRPFGLFEAYLGKEKVGYATLTNKGSEYLLQSIDIFDHSEDGGENYQRRGFGTQLMQAIAKYLRYAGATKLKSANEGSGTVQMLDKVFGRENVHHFHRGLEVDFEQAKDVMDVQYGRTLSSIDLKPPSQEEVRQEMENDDSYNFDADEP